MKFLAALFYILFIYSSCSDRNGDSAQSFCDTACSTDTLKYKADHSMEPFVTLSFKNCLADTLTWSHKALPTNRQIHMGTFFEKPMKLNGSGINCVIKDTSYAWLTFNDCATGRGYLLKLPFNKKESINKISSALNSFDKKFAVPDDLRAYTDYSTLYVVDINTGNKAEMTFKEEYKIDFDNIHETIDSVNVSKNRMFIQLIKNGKKIPLEKQISL